MGVQCICVQGEEMFLSRSTHRCVCVCVCVCVCIRERERERDSVTFGVLAINAELALLLVEVGLIIL